MTMVGYFNSLRELGGMKRLAKTTSDPFVPREDEPRAAARARAAHVSSHRS
jgi:hypothetical protein